MEMLRFKNFIKKEKLRLAVNVLPLVVSMVVFFGFGLFHLSKFETTDEHFWKYDRIEKYYNGLKEGVEKGIWKKTRINDKPGVTVAMIDGMAVPFFGLVPEDHRDWEGEKVYKFFNEEKNKERELFTMYHTEETESLNFSLRLPGLLFNVLVILPLIFWLTLKITRNRLLSGIVILLVGTSPVLIGISQIINPDAFLWGFFTVSIFSYIAYLYRKEKKFLFVAGISTGLALLSKYTANLLFLFYPILFVLYTLFNYLPKEKVSKKYIWEYVKAFILVIGVSLCVFVFFMPAVIFEPRNFLYGTFYSPTLAPIVDVFIGAFNFREIIFYSEDGYRTLLMAPFSLVVFLLSTIVFPAVFLWIAQRFQKLARLVLKASLVLMIFVFLFSLANAWMGTPFFSLDNLKEESRVAGELIFPDFADNSTVVFYLKAFTVQAQNLVFSLTPIVLLFVLFLWVRVLQDKITQKNLLPVIYLFSFVAPFVFFAGALFADILVNVRYSIVLFPMFAFLGALGFYEAMSLFFKRFNISDSQKGYFKYAALLVVVLFHLCSLWSIKPFYFNYHSSLLPKEYLVTDSWGYGSYEAAEYLNELPNSSELVVWTDHDGVCQFFVGKCITSTEVYLEYVEPDYFVFSRRGSVTEQFKAVGSSVKDIRPSKYYSQKFLRENTVFELHIGNRAANFVRVVKVP